MNALNTKLSAGVSSGSLDLSEVGTVSSFSSTVVVQSTSASSTSNQSSSSSSSQQETLKDWGIALIVLACLFIIGAAVAFKYYRHKKILKAQQELNQTKEIQFQEVQNEEVKPNQVLPLLEAEKTLFKV
jgi:hypothetical protein